MAFFKSLLQTHMKIYIFAQKEVLWRFSQGPWFFFDMLINIPRQQSPLRKSTRLAQYHMTTIDKFSLNIEKFPGLTNKVHWRTQEVIWIYPERTYSGIPTTKLAQEVSYACPGSRRRFGQGFQMNLTGYAETINGEGSWRLHGDLKCSRRIQLDLESLSNQ